MTVGFGAAVRDAFPYTALYEAGPSRHPGRGAHAAGRGIPKGASWSGPFGGRQWASSGVAHDPPGPRLTNGIPARTVRCDRGQRLAAAMPATTDYPTLGQRAESVKPGSIGRRRERDAGLVSPAKRDELVASSSRFSSSSIFGLPGCRRRRDGRIHVLVGMNLVQPRIEGGQ
jgi:hypothetical protein